jgi:integrase
MAKDWGPVRLANEIQRVRSVFKYGYEAGLIDRPVRYGPNFKKPSSKVLRKERTRKGRRTFDPKELRAVLDAAEAPLKAMILLGINCGFGNTDVATLPMQALDLQDGWVDYPRPKTGVPRLVPLWPETIQAIRDSLAIRPAPKNESHAGLVFITKRGRSFAAGHSHWRVAGEMAKLLQRTTVKRSEKEQSVYRPGLSFYALRHTFQTIGDEARDPVAVQAVMGHAPYANDMATVYRERISDDRLRAVVDHVRTWLFGADLD